LLKKAHSLVSVVLLVVALALSGCSSSTKEGTTSQNGGKDKKVTITFMHLWTPGSSKQQNMVVNKIIKEFEEQNPNITVKQETLENEQYKNKLKVLAASNELPDVGMTWAAGFLEPYAKGNLFAPLDDVLDSGLKEKFVSGTTEAYVVDGHTYALPIELNIVPVFYNKDIFSRYNLQPPKTLDDLKNIITVLNKNGVTPITLGGKDAWPASFWYMYLAERMGGPNLLDQSVANKTFSDPSLINAAKVVQELVDMKAFIKGFNGLSNDEAKSEFMNEKAAMFAMGTWEVPNYTTNPDVPQEFKDKIGFFKFPTVSGGKGDVNDWVGGVGVGLFVSKNSKFQDETKKFVNFFVRKWGEYSVADAGIIPATKVDTASMKLPPMYVDILNELNNARKITLYLDVQMKPEASEEHHKLIQALFGKDVTPQEFAKKQEDALKTGN